MTLPFEDYFGASGAVGDVKDAYGPPASGWAIANGQVLSRAAYPEAFAAFGHMGLGLRVTASTDMAAITTSYSDRMTNRSRMVYHAGQYFVLTAGAQSSASKPNVVRFATLGGAANYMTVANVSTTFNPQTDIDAVGRPVIDGANAYVAYKPQTGPALLLGFNVSTVAYAETASFIPAPKGAHDGTDLAFAQNDYNELRRRALSAGVANTAYTAQAVAASNGVEATSGSPQGFAGGLIKHPTTGKLYLCPRNGSGIFESVGVTIQSGFVGLAAARLGLRFAARQSNVIVFDFDIGTDGLFWFVTNYGVFCSADLITFEPVLRVNAAAFWQSQPLTAGWIEPFIDGHMIVGGTTTTSGTSPASSAGVIVSRFGRPFTNLEQNGIPSFSVNVGNTRPSFDPSGRSLGVNGDASAGRYTTFDIDFLTQFCIPTLNMPNPVESGSGDTGANRPTYGIPQKHVKVANQ